MKVCFILFCFLYFNFFHLCVKYKSMWPCRVFTDRLQSFIDVRVDLFHLFTFIIVLTNILIREHYYV